MKAVEARDLVDSALVEDTVTAQSTVKDISKNYRYRVPKVLVQTIFEKLADYRQYLGDVPRLDVLMRLVNLAVWTNIARTEKNAIRELIFVGLQHSSGKIRQNARTLNENYSRFLSDRSIVSTRTKQSGSSTIAIDRSQEPASEPIEFLHEVERLIKQYEPKNIPLYIDKASPSVYKSLVMVWHDTMASHQLWEQLNYQERMADLDIPGYSELNDGEDDAPEEEYYTREEWKDYLKDWIVCDDWGRAQELLDQQEKLAVVLLKRALADNLVDDKYRKQIIKLARSSNPRQLEDILMEVGSDIWTKYKRNPTGISNAQ